MNKSPVHRGGEERRAQICWLSAPLYFWNGGDLQEGGVLQELARGGVSLRKEKMWSRHEDLNPDRLITEQASCHWTMPAKLE